MLYGAYLVGFTFSRKRHDPDGLFDMRQIGLAVQNLMARRADEHISNHNTRRALGSGGPHFLEPVAVTLRPQLLR